MNTLLLILAAILLVLTITRIILVIFNPSRTEKNSGIISSIAVFCPLLIFLKNKDYYFGPAPLLVKVFIATLLLFFCILILLANYNEYKDYKEYEVFTKKSKQIKQWLKKLSL